MFNVTDISMYAVSNDSGPNGGQNVSAAMEGTETLGERTVIKLTGPDTGTPAGTDAGFIWFHDDGQAIPNNSLVSGEGLQVQLPISTLNTVLALFREYGPVALLSSPDGMVAFLQTESQHLSASTRPGRRNL
jgi:hypothetical protein